MLEQIAPPQFTTQRGSSVGQCKNLRRDSRAQGLLNPPPAADSYMWVRCWAEDLHRRCARSAMERRCRACRSRSAPTAAIERTLARRSIAYAESNLPLPATANVNDRVTTDDERPLGSWRRDLTGGRTNRPPPPTSHPHPPHSSLPVFP